MRAFLPIALAMVLCFFSPAASAAPAERLLAHSTNFAQVAPERWVAEGWRVENPDPGAVLGETEDAVVSFVVTRPNAAMAWTLTTEPIWTAPFRTLALSYFVEGPIDGGTAPFIELFDGSTGPITPGATNTENPLASGGRFSCGTLTPGLNVLVVDLSEAENLERVSEITVTVRSGAGPVAVRFNQLTFLADAAELHETEISGEPLGAAEKAFVPLSLPESGSLRLADVARSFGIAEAVLGEGDVQLAGLPFRLGPGAVTPLTRGGALTLAGPARGASLALLCATRLWGSGEGWYSKGSFVPRREAAGAHQFRVLLRYGDGSVSGAVPLRVADGGIGIQPGLGVYRVALDPDKELIEVACVEEMSFGQVAVLAASVLEGSLAREEKGAPAAVTAAAEEPVLEREAPEPAAGTYVLEGEGIQIHLDAAAEVQAILGVDGHAWTAAPFPLVALTDDSGVAHPLRLVEAMASPERDRLVLVWAVGDTPHHLELALTARAEGGVLCGATLSNGGETPWRTSLRLPALAGLRASSGEALTYMLGARSAIHDSAPIEVAEVYGGRFPLQFMDVYDGEGGGGLACLVLDESRRRKWFEFQQDKAGHADLSVSYRGLELAPGERLGLPPAVLLAHGGDWREPFQQYKDWVQARFPRVRSNTMAEVFYCRRDYPLGGTSYLYDVGVPGYSFEKLISESNWAFGGVEMVDISGWAYNEEVGRVGTYLQNDLGGLEALARGVETAHGRGVQVGLYFEGYLLDKRAADGARGLAEWQLIRAGDKPAWWPGEMEFFCCPGAPGWQEKLASEIAEVARVTGADAVYVDQLGICDTGKECWSAEHGHPVPSNPIEEEIALLQRIRTALDAVRPACAIYIEHLPCDAMTPYIDGAFNMGMKHTRHALGATKLPLHRYLTPEVPVFEMVAHGIRPIPAEADDLKLSFFHGIGLWLKGRGASWYSEGFRALAPKFHTVLVDYSAYFRSPGAAPHVDTLVEGVYANRFPKDGAVLYTLYNAGPVTVSGPVLDLGGGRLASVLYGAEPLSLSEENGRVVAAGFFPQAVAAILVASVP